MKQLDPRAFWLFFINSFSGLVFPVAFLIIGLRLGSAASEFTGDQSFISFSNWFWLAIPSFIVLGFVWSKLTYRFYKYELTDVGFRKEYGVIYKKYVTIPYDRIQNVDIYRGILARILGLSDLNIQTAGASAVVSRNGYSGGVVSEGRLPGLSKEVAEQLRDELINRTRKTNVQGL